MDIPTTPEQQLAKRLTNEYKEGASLRELSLKYNVSHGLIRNILINTGVILRKRGNHPMNALHLLYSEDAKPIITSEDFIQNKEICSTSIKNKPPCKRCGYIYKGFYRLVVHHINPFLRYDNPKEYLTTTDRVVLCNRCHIITHHEINTLALELIRDNSLDSKEKKSKLINLSKRLLEIPTAIQTYDNPTFTTKIEEFNNITIPEPIMEALHIQSGDDIYLASDGEQIYISTKSFKDYPENPSVFNRESGNITSTPYKNITNIKYKPITDSKIKPLTGEKSKLILKES